MKKLLIFGNFLLLTLFLRAQSGYFLFIQSDNNQPFYVQSEGRILSSSAAGHLIMAGLTDSVYRLTVGFPKNQFPEQVFEVRMNRRDAGYQLKNVGADGWSLVNLQTPQQIKPVATGSKKQVISYGDVKKGDVFSVLMAGLVNDSAVLYTSIAKAEPVKADPTSSISDSPPSNSPTRQGVDPRSDASVSKIESDTSRVQAAVVKPVDAVPVDTAVVKIQATQYKDLKAVVDSPVAKSVPAKADSVAKTNPYTITSEVAVQPANEKKNTPDTNNPESAKLPPVVLEKTVTQPKVEEGTEKQVSDAAGNNKAKSLIVWFSETKTDRGTELVYLDMTVPDKTDTIRILIPTQEVVEDAKKEDKTGKETESGQGVKTDSMEDTGQDEKSGAAKFFGKIFGKKNNSTSAGKDKTKSKESSITVTTVETKETADTTRAASNKVPAGREEVASNSKEGNEKAETKSSGNFLQKIFGKNNARADGDTAKAGSVTVKVTTVENKSSDSVKSGTKRTSDAAEVEKLKKAQEAEETTSTQRFFGKLFGKKNKDTVAASPAQSSVKVTPVPDASPAQGKKQETVVVNNSDCRQFASASDLDKLRVRMLGERDVDAQVTEARKLFKVKCLSTEQVQSLSTLFRTDEGKYKLFDAAYPFVSDTQNFHGLVGLLSEEYYVNRFKAMVRK